MSYTDNRIKGERERARQALQHLRSFVDSMESHLDAEIPTAGVRQGLVQAAVGVSERFAVIDVLMLVKKNEGTDGGT